MQWSQVQIFLYNYIHSLISIIFSPCRICVKFRSKQPITGGDLTYASPSFDMKPVPHECLEEQAVGLESEEKQGDLNYERYKII